MEPQSKIRKQRVMEMGGFVRPAKYAESGNNCRFNNTAQDFAAEMAYYAAGIWAVSRTAYRGSVAGNPWKKGAFTRKNVSGTDFANKIIESVYFNPNGRRRKKRVGP
jgi:hypothetical protein